MTFMSSSQSLIATLSQNMTDEIRPLHSLRFGG
jgi:hypothetical protein